MTNENVAQAGDGAQGVADNEAIYDAEIAPLMARIIEVCEAHNIPALATFEYAKESYCSTILPQRGMSDDMDQLCSIMHGFKVANSPPPPVQLTVTHADGSKTIEVILP